jgi:hypothetical protein
VSDDPSLVRYIGGRKFTLSVLVILLGTGLAAAGKLSTEWVALAGSCLGVFTGANLWLETRPRP